MPTIIRFFIFLIAFSFSSCVIKKTCSGLSPDVGSCNTVKKIRKARRHAHSIPEKNAETNRLKTVKHHKSSKLTKTTGKQGGILHLGNKKKAGKKKGGGSSDSKGDGKLHLDKKS